MLADVEFPIHTATLDNGLRVHVSPDRQVPITAVNLWYDVGSRDELPGQTGWAHLFEHLMFQGSANVASGEHLEALQSVGGSANATTWFDRTNYFETVPKGALNLALWMEADRLASLADCLTETSVATQRDVVKEERRQRYDNVPYGDAIEHLIKLTFPADHPYGHSTIGSMADLDLATREGAQAFFREHYTTSNAVLTICGDISPAKGFKKAQKYFGALPSTPPPARRVPEPLPPLTGVPRLEVAAPVPADAVFVSWRLPAIGHPDYDAAALAMAILGFGMASRFYRGLILGGLAQSASCAPLGLVGGNSFGYAVAYCLPGTPAEDLEAKLLEEVALLAANGPQPAETARVRTQHARDWLTSLADIGRRADAICEAATLLRDPGRVNRRLEEVNRVTDEQIQQAAQTYLAPESRSVVHYLGGPR
ncbi:MAG: insulinase family protein [Propionibacteriaceae bacterium]|nr:insulinase family protein [Propionibacteriaceae bacterium]